MPKKKDKTELTIEEKLNQALIPIAEQPYEIPENWCWSYVGNFVSIFRGVSYKKYDAHDNKEIDDYLILRGGNILEGGLDLENDNVYVNKSLVNKEQLLQKHDIIVVASTGSKKVIGRAGITQQDFSDVAFGAFLMLVRPKSFINPNYLDYFFQSQLYRNRMRELASGTNINNIKTEYITSTYFPLPPLPEQQRIVDLIERLFAKLDEAKEKVQTAIDSFELRKAAILHKAFTGELTRRWREEKEQNAESKRAEERRAESGELGKTHFIKGSNETADQPNANTTEGVAMKTPSVSHMLASSPTCVGAHLKDCHNRSDLGKDFRFKQDAPPEFLKKIAGGAVSSLTEGVLTETADQPNANTTEGLPLGWKKANLGDLLFPMETKKPTGKYFKYIDIDSIDNIHQKVSEPKLLSVEKAPSRASRGLSKDVVLFSMVRPYLKNIAYIDESLSDCIASTGFYVCKCKENLSSYYLYYFLISKDAIDYLMQFMRGDNSPSIRTGDFLGMDVPLPPLSEQKEIVRILDTLLAKSDKAKELAENSLENIETLKKTILAKAFRGLLGTNRPDEVSSLELLKEVL